MILTIQAIKEYQSLYKKVFGDEISMEKAREEGERLIRLVRVVYGQTLHKVNSQNISM